MSRQNNTSVQRPVLPVLREMGIGDSVVYPLERRSYVASICVRFGQEWGKIFSTKTNREDRTITVTRIS